MSNSLSDSSSESHASLEENEFAPQSEDQSFVRADLVDENMFEAALFDVVEQYEGQHQEEEELRTQDELLSCSHSNSNSPLCRS